MTLPVRRVPAPDAPAIDRSPLPVPLSPNRWPPRFTTSGRGPTQYLHHRCSPRGEAGNVSTAIEWTDETWNPIIGCSRVSPGCDHCYAVGVVHRQMSPQHVGLTVKPEGAPTDWTGEVRPAGDKALTKPLRWRKPRRIFVNSLSDLFHADLPDDEIAKVFAVMALTPQHTYQVLTKRPQRMATLLGSREWAHQLGDEVERRTGQRPEWRLPLPNVWLGTSIETDRYTFRADHLRRTPAAVRFISAEPLLGPLPSLDLTGIDWLIVGGESGPGARPMHPEWARELWDRCKLQWDPAEQILEESDSGPAFFFKQWGDWTPMAPLVEGVFDFSAGHALANDGTLYGPHDLDYPDGPRRCEAFRARHDKASLSSMYRLGKKAAGRTLDGRTWDEYPT